MPSPRLHSLSPANAKHHREPSSISSVTNHLSKSISTLQTATQNQNVRPSIFSFLFDLVFADPFASRFPMKVTVVFLLWLACINLTCAWKFELKHTSTTRSILSLQRFLMPAAALEPTMYISPVQSLQSYMYANTFPHKSYALGSAPSTLQRWHFFTGYLTCLICVKLSFFFAAQIA